MSSQPSTKLGRIELICGCMFSGKSERLLDRLADARARGVPSAAFKHASDDRYSRGEIVTHSRRRDEAVPVACASRIVELAGDARLVVIDEAQFFDGELAAICRRLAAEGRDVVVAGLNRDSWGLPFGPVPELAEIADVVTSTQAVCAVCGGAADYTQRRLPVSGQTMIGGAEAYEARCGKCFEAPPIELRR